MHPDTMRLIDRWVGIPLCFVTGLWSWLRTIRKAKSDNYLNQDSPEIIIFIGLAEIGALVVAYALLMLIFYHLRLQAVQKVQGLMLMV